jgi:hypothetical protein
MFKGGTKMIKCSILISISGLYLAALAQDKPVPVGPDSGVIVPEARISVAQTFRQANTYLVSGKEKGYGFSFVLTPGVCRVDLEPVRQVVARDPDLATKQFDWAPNKLGTVGVLMYAGVGGGVRFGFNGTFGFKSYYSDTYTGLDSLGVARDSEAVIDLMLTYGGLTVEKAWTAGHFTFFAGGLAGGGALILLKTLQSESSPFTPSDGSSYSGMMSGYNPQGRAVAPLLVAGLQAGVTYSFTSWFHLGFDTHNELFYSQRGFGFGSKEFSAWDNPGGRVRIIFGNLG